MQQSNQKIIVGEKFVNFLYIKKPTINGGKVVFSWATDYDQQPSADSIYVDYDGIDISQVPIEAHYNTIIGLLLNKLIDLPYETVVVTEDAVPGDMIDFWLSYHDLDLVRFANVSDKSVLKGAKSSSGNEIGILYGGGKDSYYALDTFSKNPAIDKIKLLSFVIPDAHVNEKQLEERRDKLIAGPILDEYNVEFIKIRTSARAVIKGYHMELYLAPLGVLVWLDMMNFVTFSYEYCHYFIPKGNASFGFERSQLSHMQNISKFYTKTFSPSSFAVFNANQHMTELSSFGYLAKNNPEFYQSLVMCESTVDVDKKWCCSCTKCAEFVLFSMYYNLPQQDINLDWFFTESGWIKKVLKQLSAQQEKGLFFTGLTHHLHFDSFCFVLTKLKDRNIQFRLPEALNNFNILAENYYDESIEGEDCFYGDILEAAYPEKLHEGAVTLLSPLLPEIEAPKQKHSGNHKIYFDKNILPIIKNRVFALSPEQWAEKLLKNRMSAPRLAGSAEAVYIDQYEVQLLNGLKESDIAFNVNNHAFDVYFEKNPLFKSEGGSFYFRFPVRKNYKTLSFKLDIPHFSEELDKRFALSVKIGDTKQTLSLAKRHYLMTSAVSNADFANGFVDIAVEIAATKNVEPWRWGRACRIICRDFLLFLDSSKLNQSLDVKIIEFGASVE
ncbi:hypothetical protein [Pasteurella testudinis]|uniref:hypothetical protein n=1 Tax=Pasteurella testudinis TaxID=761 RepID=UPI00405975FD